MARLLGGLIADLSLRRVLEFGAGLSSLIIVDELSRWSGGRLTSLENDDRYCRDNWSAVRRYPNVDAELVLCSLGVMQVENRAVAVYHDDGRIERRGPYDVVFIDGPSREIGREGTLYQAWGSLLPGAIVVLDDAARPGERAALSAWLRRYPSLSLLLLDERLGRRGVAILQATDP